MSKEALALEIRETLEEIAKQVKAIGDRNLTGASPHVVRDGEGRYLTAPLLLAKAQCLSALASLESSGMNGGGE